MFDAHEEVSKGDDDKEDERDYCKHQNRLVVVGRSRCGTCCYVTGVVLPWGRLIGKSGGVKLRHGESAILESLKSYSAKKKCTAVVFLLDMLNIETCLAVI